MTYDAQEISLESGQPVELYEFQLVSEVFRYTSQESDISIMGTDYTALEGLSRTQIKFNKRGSNDPVTITLPGSNTLIARYKYVVPGSQATVNIKRVHRNDGALQTSLIFKGSIRSVIFSADGIEAQVECASLASLEGYQMPRYTFQASCNAFLYDAACAVSETSFRQTVTVDSVSQDNLVLSGFTPSAADYFVPGRVTNIVTGESRTITAQSGATSPFTVTLLYPFSADLTGTSVYVSAGCSHAATVCDSKFANLANHQGNPFHPLRNIFRVGLR